MPRLLLSLLKSGVLAVLFVVPATAQFRDARVHGSVADPSGAAIGDARIELFTTSGTPAGASHSRADGSFEVAGLGGGSYALEVSAPLFATRRIQVDVGSGSTRVVDVQLGIAEYHSQVSVTAERGRVADVTTTAPLVTARDADAFSQQALPTIGHALTGAAGVMPQQSTYGQISPFLRGLTGYQVLNLVDGVRFNNTTFRSGPNQYLALTDPSQAERIEALLGPSSSQFGSDALGGTIQVLTPAPRFLDAGTLAASALVNVSSASADGSRASDASLLIKTRRAYASVGGSWRALGDLRAGGGVDSHHVFKRLFGLSNGQLRILVGSQQTGTGFSQTAAHAKVAIRLKPDQTMTVLYQASEQRGVTGYKDVWGGLGRVRSDFSPQQLQFAYGRYETLATPGLDALTATVSINAQTDGSVRQNLRFTDAVTTDRVEVAAFGYAAQATTHFTTHDAAVFGAELYDEHVDARRDVTNPVTGLTDQRRALYPNGSVYRTAGFFLQDVFAAGSIKAVVGARYTRVTAQTFADRNLTSFGTALGGFTTPETQQAECDLAMGLIVQSVANSRYAADTLVIITEDDVQDGPDHIDSHRGTAFVVGPYVKQGQVVGTHYSQVNALRTIEDILGTEHINLNTAFQRPMADVFDVRSSGAWSYSAIASTYLAAPGVQLADARVGVTFAPGPVLYPVHDAAYWDKATAGFNFDEADMVPPAIFNRVVWSGLMNGKPYPTIRYGADTQQGH